MNDSSSPPSELAGILGGWSPDRRVLRNFFSEDEIRKLDAARRAVRPDMATIVYGVYENPFAKSGGIFAVADFYSQTLVREGRNVVVLAPYHSKLRTSPAAESATGTVGHCQVTLDGRLVSVELREHLRGDVRWVLLKADGFFEAGGGAGGTDPYSHAEPGKLLEDSLFASAAVPHALATLGLRDNVLVHVQDWELASTALTVKQALLDGVLGSAAVVLTSHNPYDHVLAPHELRKISYRPYHGDPSDHTVYQHMIPLCDAPVTTVSRTFARELVSDPLQTEHFADHLQDVFRRQMVVGVDNGLFGSPQPAFSDKAVEEAAAGKYAAILREKKSKRRKMLVTLAAYQDSRIVGRLDGGDGRALVDLPDDVPVFLMFGRLDPGQKGFDVLARAVEAVPPGRARFLFTPIVAGTPHAFRDDLELLAGAKPGEVAIYPFRMEKGYLEAQAGATYAVLPSIYEPFGGATEPYLAGTPVVARATGGLVQQVVDADADAEHSTGLLFREKQPHVPGQWRTLQSVPSPAARMAIPVYGAMVASLAATLVRAESIYRTERSTYGRMLANLFPQAQHFTWERAFREYSEVYAAAVR